MSLPASHHIDPPSPAYRVTNKGDGTIAGVTQIAGLPAPCRIALYRSDHVLIGTRSSGSDGAYSFENMAAGIYYLVITDDNQGAYRGKVEHVEVT